MNEKTHSLSYVNNALLNSFIMHNKANPNKVIQYKNYLFSITSSWATIEINETSPNNSRATVSTIDPPGRLSDDMRKHILQNIKATPKKKFSKREGPVCKSLNKISE